MSTIFGADFAPSGSSKGTIALVHGLGEHSGRYSHVISHLTEAGFAVATGDLPGFGQSGGRRGHMGSFEEYLEFTDGLITRARSLAGDLPIFLMGHSLGGLICYRYAQVRAHGTNAGSIRGLILSAPAIRLRAQVPGWKVGMAGVLNAVAPTLPMWNEVRAEDLSHDKTVVDAYRADPLNYSKVTVRWYQLFSREMRLAETGGTPAFATLLLTGDGDRLVDTNWLDAHFRASGHGVAVRRYPGLYHEIMNEPEKGMVLDDIVDWLNREVG